MDFLEHPALKTLGGMLLDFIGVSTFFVCFIAWDAHAGTKEEKKVRAQPDIVFTYEEHMRECLKRRTDKRKCEMLIDARKNLDDAKKLSASPH